jgi:hypothetical protein
MSILFYIYSATGRHGEFALHELALKRWCRVQAGVAKGEFTMDDFLGNLASTVSGGVTRPEWESLTTWTTEAKKNPPILVPEDDHSPDFVLVTDGSGYGWGALLISTKSGLFKVAHNAWPPELRDLAKSSSLSEPWAVLAAAHSFFTFRTKADVLSLSDNKGNVATIEKGWSKTEQNHVMRALRTDFPYLNWRSKYIPGSIIVADEPSRGYELDPSKLARLQQYLKQNITN